MRTLVLSVLLATAITPATAAERYPDRFVWVFGWNLNQPGDVSAITPVLETAGRHGLNGAVVSFGLDSLCKKPPEFFQRLDAVKAVCDREKLELIPSIFSVGYGGGALSHNRNLAEGFPVENAVFRVSGKEARFVPDASARLANGDFEAFQDNRFKGFGFHDQPGEISFVDTQTRHGGKAAIRFENFQASPHGHGRVMQEIAVRPRHCYRVRFWVKTEGLEPAGAFRATVLAGERALAPREFQDPGTADWRPISFLFNSLDETSVRIYAGVWGGKSGRFWLDDWTIEEAGPIAVLHRPGTPVTVTSADGATTYVEGRDYEPLGKDTASAFDPDRPFLPLKLTASSRIRNGQTLHVSWYHPMTVHSGQVTVCMAEPELYEIYDHEAKLLAEHLRPKRILLNMDEIRMGGTCRACQGRNMGELLGECVTKQVAALRKHMPGVEVYIWSDMLDPNHNAHDDYYLVQGDFTGSWKHVPKDLILAVWGAAPREKSLKFCAGQGCRTLAACDYDADDLDDVRAWLKRAKDVPHVQGLMYTPWERKYKLLGAFGDLLK